MSNQNEIEVFPTTAELRAYLNGAGGITLIQDGLFGEADQTIYVPMDRVEALVAALYNLRTQAEEE